MEYNLEKIAEKQRIKKSFKKIIKIIFTIFIILLFILMVLINYDENNERGKLGELYLFNIVSESMKPTINKDDIIVVKKVSIEDLKEGDIITFHYENRVISHRISKIDIGNQKNIHTKGDNNESEDTFIIDNNQIYGKVILKIPKLAEYIQYLQKGKGFINVLLSIIIIYIFYNYKSEKKYKRKIVRRKYEIKKIRDKYK